MNRTLISTLEQLRIAKVQVLSLSMRKQISLFDFETGPEIIFNGFNSIILYQGGLDKLYEECKKSLEHELNQMVQSPVDLKMSLDLSRFEIKAFKNRYFPKNNEIVLFNRVEFNKTPMADLSNNLSLKKK
jgi:hypothetical protein